MVRIRAESILKERRFDRRNRCKLDDFFGYDTMKMQCCMQADIGWLIDLIGKKHRAVRILQILGERE